MHGSCLPTAARTPARFLHTAARATLLGSIGVALAACNSGSSSSGDAPTSAYKIGGNITGFDAGQLVLQNNEGDDLSIAAGATSFEFATSIQAGGSYSITILTAPEGKTCTVGNGAGSNISADVDNVSVVCSAAAYSIGGTVSGLTTNGLVLQNNGGDDIALAAGATSLQFPSAIAAGGDYAVTVLEQPDGLVCTVGNGTGTGVAANVNTISVACSAMTFELAGQVFGLTNSGLVLRNNGSDDLSLPINAGYFEFTTPIALGGSYNITVSTQPAGLTCTLINGTGHNIQSSISAVYVSCNPTPYYVSGTVSGLSGTGLVLRNNGGDDLVIPAGETSFLFSTPVAFGSVYNVTVQTQPTAPTQNCTVTDGAGTDVQADVQDVAISCTTTPTLTSVNPGVGTAVAGRDSVTLTGSGFTGATSVTFCGAPATAFTVDSDTQITVETPTLQSGACDIVLTTSNGQATLANSFTFLH